MERKTLLAVAPLGWCGDEAKHFFGPTTVDRRRRVQDALHSGRKIAATRRLSLATANWVLGSRSELRQTLGWRMTFGIAVPSRAKTI